MVRGDEIPGLHDAIGKEAADVVIYIDLLCTHLNINLEAAIVQKFNEVSDRVNSPLKLK
jgi:NTP pyrophosphatase (non-canonical NTP hydrolase)